MADVGDRVFCHACGGVWLRNRHGLVCPHCESDFTEIIEIPPDPDEVPPDDFPDPPTSVPVERLHSPANPWVDPDPWPHLDDNFQPIPEEDGFRHRSYRSPDGRISFSTTTFTHGASPHRARGPATDPLLPMVRGLDTIFNGLAETYRHAGQYQQMGERARARRPSQQAEGSGSPSAASPQGPRVWHGSFGFSLGGNGGARSEYHSTGGLHPRDADGPQMNTPLRTLGDVLELFRADFGGDGGDPVGGPPRAPNPLAMLSALLNLERHGDAVYSQEELDRVISELVGQNVNGTAPPPASRSAIQSLPKKKVDQEMLGNDGRAECSICMDPVELGTEVTVLPCKHWFHFQCIEMWLNQHNTCPHCRRGIDAPAHRAEGSSENPVVIEDSPEPVSRRSSTTGNAGNSGSSSGGGLTGWVRSRFGGS